MLQDNVKQRIKFGPFTYPDATYFINRIQRDIKVRMEIEEQ
jgi:hypothetical protein